MVVWGRAGGQGSLLSRLLTSSDGFVKTGGRMGRAGSDEGVEMLLVEAVVAVLAVEVSKKFFACICACEWV